MFALVPAGGLRSTGHLRAWVLATLVAVVASGCEAPLDAAVDEGDAAEGPAHESVSPGASDDASPGEGLVAQGDSAHPNPGPDQAPVAGAGAAPTGVEVGDPFVGLTYHRDVRPILEQNCVSCHADERLDRPVLTTWAHVEPAALRITTAVESGDMPYWRADPTCRPLATPTGLHDAEVETIVRWFDDGAVEGDPADYVPPELPTAAVPALGEPNLVVDTGVDFQVPEGGLDQSLCFPIDVDLTGGLFLRAVDVRPEAPDVVHHAVLWAVNGAVPLPSAENGWSCDYAKVRPVGADVPGNVAHPFPHGAVTEIAPTERLVVQLHYHYHPSASAIEVPPTDRTRIALWTVPGAQAPSARLVYDVAKPTAALFIPAGEPEVEIVGVEAIVEPTMLVGVAPHMHLFGARIEADIVRADGLEECLIAIPEWRFDRQQLYFFPDDQPVLLDPGDSIRIRCVYDNSPDNQPVVGGEQLTPSTVYFGSRSTDEMCQLVMLSLETK